MAPPDYPLRSWPEGPPRRATFLAMDAKFWVLATPAPDLPGKWNAHCLDLDIVTQGESLQHAFQMANEAVLLAVGDDIVNGLDPRGRKRAPQEDWDLLHRVVEAHRPLSDDANPTDVQAVATLLHVFTLDATEPAVVRSAPPDWQIAC